MAEKVKLNADISVFSDLVIITEDWIKAPCLHNTKSGHESFAVIQQFECSLASLYAQHVTAVSQSAPSTAP